MQILDLCAIGLHAESFSLQTFQEQLRQQNAAAKLDERSEATAEVIPSFLLGHLRLDAVTFLDSNNLRHACHRA